MIATNDNAYGRDHASYWQRLALNREYTEEEVNTIITSGSLEE
jgi:hypothetical protein